MKTMFSYKRTAVLLALATSVSTLPAVHGGENKLVGHWRLAGDVRDHSGSGNDGQNHGVKLGEPASKGSGRFDGRNGHIEVAASDSLRLGNSTFSLALWVNTAEKLDDVLGDLISKYDPATRTGFNFSIQNNAGVTSSQSNHRHVHFGIDNGRSEAKWTDHGRMGDAVLIYGMTVYHDQLFVGTCEAGIQESGRVFRYDGQKWIDCGSPDKCNSVSSLAVYDGKLYVGVSKYRLAGSSLAESDNPNLGGKIYRYDGDNQWTHCGTLPDVEAINGLVVYRGKMYASSMYAPAGFFRYEGGTKWVSCGTPGDKRVESLTVYNGSIFATGYDEGAVYRYDGQGWEDLGVLEGANQTYGFATHSGQLFVSEWPHAKVFRWAGGKKWIPSGRLGEELETMPLIVYNGKMYAGTLPSAEVYRFDDPNWTKFARLDFTPDVRYRRTWTMAVYKGRLFAGTLPSGHVHSIEVGRNVTCDRALPAGWVHLAAVRADDHLRLYVNGKRVATSAKFSAADYGLSNDKPLKIGFGAHDYFSGKLADVRVYSGALSENEIAELASADTAPTD
ncbi:MAG: hypothetical protein CMJ64_07455 [Planctomycetaceae bacterium]|nr:hypothetical protein [Planctomycetaceae bacterium]